MNRAVIGLGSNIDRDNHIAQARKRLCRAHRVLAESRFVETEPVGFRDQPRFLNGAVLIETEMTRHILEEWLHQTEIELGRVRGPNRCGPRTIDLDLVVWNGDIIDQDVRKRAFLRQAILEVLPDLEIKT